MGLTGGFLGNAWVAHRLSDFLSAAGCFSLSRNPIRSVNSSGVNVLARLLTGMMCGGNPGGRLEQRANELSLVASGSQPVEVRAWGAGSAPRRGMTSAAGDLLVLEEKLFPFSRIGQMTEGEPTQGLDVGRSRGRSARELDLRIDRAADGLKGLLTRAAERGIGIAGGLAIDRLGPGVGHHAERGDRLRTQVRVGLAGAGGLDQPRDGLA